jgi:hypothetical protein
MAPARMSGQIFISYRRDDSSASAGRLYDRLLARLPNNHIFIDVDLEPGIDFVEAIETSVGSCDVLIAVIGKRWVRSSVVKGKRCLENPEDFVRVEIATALKRNIRVIPVLVDDASMPWSTDLPDDLKLLTRRNALEVSHNRFNADFARLVAAIERVLEKANVERKPPEEKGRPEIELFSCFISLDKPFALWLHEALQSKGIKCCLDEKQLLPGDDILRQLERGIHLWDKFLLCASKNSLTSWWVEDEIKTTLEKERALRK